MLAVAEKEPCDDAIHMGKLDGEEITFTLALVLPFVVKFGDSLAPALVNETTVPPAIANNINAY